MGSDLGALRRFGLQGVDALQANPQGICLSLNTVGLFLIAAREHAPVRTVRPLRTRASERTYYRIWALVG